MADFSFRQGDTKPWALTLKEDGVAVNLTAATQVRLYLRKQRGATNKIDGAACTVTTAASGIIAFAPSAANVNESGAFYAYYRVTWTDLTETRYPSDGPGDDIEITPSFE